jgi:hypothetical protein
MNINGHGYAVPTITSGTALHPATFLKRSLASSGPETRLLLLLMMMTCGAL